MIEKIHKSKERDYSSIMLVFLAVVCVGAIVFTTWDIERHGGFIPREVLINEFPQEIV